MYRDRLWTMRQYAGFGDAVKSNERYRYLISQGISGLSVASSTFLPKLGYDSDHPLALGEVGKAGVPIRSLADMDRLFDEIPLGQVSTSMTINATAMILLAFYVCSCAAPRGRPKSAARNRAERHSEGIRRPRYLYLPSEIVDADRHRPIRLDEPRNT